MALPALAAAAPAAAPVAAAGSSAFLDSIVAGLVNGLVSQGAEKLLFGPGGGALGPSSYQTADPMGRSNYFTTPNYGLAYEQYAGPEQLKRAFLSLIPGISDKLRPLPTREEIVGGFVDGQFVGQAALTEAQAQSLTAREIARIRAEKEYEYAARLAEAQAGIQKEKIRALADAQAKVESQKVSSLGEVQSQRLQSQYGAASNLLDSAIKNIAFRDKIESANTLTELARAV